MTTVQETRVSNWESFRRTLRQSLPNGAWERWFETLEHTATETELELLTTSDLHSRRLLDRYLPLIEEAASRIYGAIEVSVTTTDRPQFDFPEPSPIVADPDPVVAAPVERPAAPTLMARYTFENFVVGSSNRFAHAAAQAVAEQPGEHYNPLVIHGGAGLGKTHLLHAVGQLAHELNPSRVIRYVTSENFLNDFIEAIRERRVDGFKAKYRTIDVLLLDDVQFLEGKENILEEFFHTFNTLYESGKQMVISSDRHPRNLSTMEDRLRSRFEWGLLTDIQAPDVETRLAILEKNARQAPVPVPQDVLHFIASQVSENIRELEGALTRVTADARLNNRHISLPRAQELLADIAARTRVLDGPGIIAAVAEGFGFHPDDLTSPGRTQPLATARQIAMYLCREFTDDSLVQIGRHFNRDHSTVVHGIDRIKDALQTDMSVFEKVNELSQRLRKTPQ
ncbi:MAG: chromosomal replication initiator protein DnaA [Longimicrobiales bacterium]